MDIGEVINDRYELLEPAAGRQGAFGEVFRAMDRLYHRPVALKKLRKEQGERWKKHLQYFQREIVHLFTLARGCRNIVQIYEFDLGEDPWIAMEWVEGESLADFVVSSRTLPVDRAVRIFDQILEAVHLIHGRGAVHRDLKPANIMLRSEDDSPVILDFGVARSTEWEAYRSAEGSTVGSPGYMAPEQFLGHACPQSDVFAVGVVLHELLSGRHPFLAGVDPDDTSAVLRATTDGPYRRLSSDFGAIADVVARAVAKAVGERYQSASEFLEELRAAAGSSGGHGVGSGQVRAPSGFGSRKKQVFVHCGDHRQAPDLDWEYIPLPTFIQPSHLAEAIQRVREAIRGFRWVRILVAGPVCLGVAIGQALQHEPVTIEYVQLNQENKEFEVWLTNRDQL